MPSLSRQTLTALEAAQALTARDLALGELAGLLDPDRTQSLHTLAGIVSRMLETHATGISRVLSGARPPRDGIEAALAVLVRTGAPTSQRRLYDLLADLAN